MDSDTKKMLQMLIDELREISKSLRIIAAKE